MIHHYACQSGLTAYHYQSRFEQYPRFFICADFVKDFLKRTPAEILVSLAINEAPSGYQEAQLDRDEVLINEVHYTVYDSLYEAIQHLYISAGYVPNRDNTNLPPFYFHIKPL